MKPKNYFSLIILIIAFSFELGAQEKGSETIKFETLGKCGMCKTKIEAAVNSIDGISYVFWNFAKNETIVTYDESKTNPFYIMQTIADTGHDTEWYRTPDAVYNLLIGSCCEYERTIDYSQVQIGYLKLMGIWVGQTSIGDNENKESVIVYPTISNDIVYIKSDLPLTNIKVDIYSMSGAMVLSEQIESNKESSLSISRLPKGNYMLFVADKKKIISVFRIIKL